MSQMDIIEKLRRQADADEQAGTLYAHEIGREAATTIERLRTALERIARWHGEFPESGHYWDEPENTKPMSYASCYGSNGERDYMRQIARDALYP